HDSQRRSDSGPRAGRNRGARDSRGTAGEGRTVPAALRQAVPVRARSIHQPGRRLHAGTRSGRPGAGARLLERLVARGRHAQYPLAAGTTCTCTCDTAISLPLLSTSTPRTSYVPLGTLRNSKTVVRGARSPSSCIWLLR